MTLAERLDPHDDVGITVGRAEDGAIVVTVLGAPGPEGRERLAQILDDLIDGQGNLFIAVQMPDSDTVDLPTLDVLLQAADRAWTHGARLTITTPVGHWDGSSNMSRTGSELQ